MRHHLRISLVPLIERKTKAKGTEEKKEMPLQDQPFENTSKGCFKKKKQKENDKREKKACTSQPKVFFDMLIDKVLWLRNIYDTLMRKSVEIIQNKIRTDFICLTWFWRSARLGAWRHFVDRGAYPSWSCGNPKTRSGVLLLIIVSCQVAPGFPPGAHGVPERFFLLSCGWCWCRCWQGHCCNFITLIFLVRALSGGVRKWSRDILPDVLRGICLVTPIQGTILFTEKCHNVLFREGITDHNGISVQIHLTGPVWRLGDRWFSSRSRCLWKVVR